MGKAQKPERPVTPSGSAVRFVQGRSVIRRVLPMALILSMVPQAGLAKQALPRLIQAGSVDYLRVRSVDFRLGRVVEPLVGLVPGQALAARLGEADLGLTSGEFLLFESLLAEKNGAAERRGLFHNGRDLFLLAKEDYGLAINWNAELSPAFNGSEEDLLVTRGMQVSLGIRPGLWFWSQLSENVYYDRQQVRSRADVHSSAGYVDLRENRSSWLHASSWLGFEVHQFALRAGRSGERWGIAQRPILGLGQMPPFDRLEIEATFGRVHVSKMVADFDYDVEHLQLPARVQPKQHGMYSNVRYSSRAVMGAVAIGTLSHWSSDSNKSASRLSSLVPLLPEFARSGSKNYLFETAIRPIERAELYIAFQRFQAHDGPQIRTRRVSVEWYPSQFSLQADLIRSSPKTQESGSVSVPRHFGQPIGIPIEEGTLAAVAVGRRVSDSWEFVITLSHLDSVEGGITSAWVDVLTWRWNSARLGAGCIEGRPRNYCSIRLSVGNE